MKPDLKAGHIERSSKRVPPDALHLPSCKQRHVERGNPHTCNSSRRLTAATHRRSLPRARSHRRDECLDIEVYTATILKT